ncbi:MAG: Sensor protein kdpD [Dactylosporangium sp.]|jgi:K+-sensing histidine kinase KdpD|nr:Sensor protein kdpD [Dactylosporangium sp.]
MEQSRAPAATSAATGRQRRRWLGAAAAIVGLGAATGLLLPVRNSLTLASVALLYLLPVIATAAIGGVWPALAAALAADLLVNFFFVPPYHTLAVEHRDNLITLIVYVIVAAAVAVAVDAASRNQAAAARRTVEAALLAGVTSEPVAGDSLTRLLEQVRVSYHMDAVALADDERVVERVGPWRDGPPSLSTPAGKGLRLLAWGPPVFAEDRGALSRLAVAAARTVENQRLADEAARTRELVQIDRLRAALLGAVGHDLRTPLAGIKAAISSLRQPDLSWDPDDEAELLATVEESTDRLSDLVENLLSLSRLQAGALSVMLRAVPLDAVVAAALLHTPTGNATVDVDVPDDLPLAYADPGLLERVIANLVDNAAKVSRTILVSGRNSGDRIELRIIDHGPGVPAVDRERMFTPFQRLDDHAADGLGLGLAIARGFTEAMAGTIAPTDTPGGGLTITITIPLAR